MSEAELILPLENTRRLSRPASDNGVVADTTPSHGARTGPDGPFSAPGGRSLVAAANAAFRAAESLRADRILDDPWAGCFGERDLRIRAIRAARYLWPKLRRSLDELQTAHCVRHRTIDELVLRSIQDGYQRVILIGAGYDMRRSRFHAALRSVRWIEVDHPSTMAMKWALLEGATGVEREVLRAPIDLERSSLADAIDWSQDVPTLFVLEGFIHYLSRPRLIALLADLSRVARRRRVVLSFIRSDMYAIADSLFIRLVRALREVPRLHFTPQELASLLSGAGLEGFRSWTGPEQIRSFAPHAAHRALRLSQDVALAEGER